VQFYGNDHNSKSNHWIMLKLYQKIPEVSFYVGVRACLAVWLRVLFK